MQQCTIFIHGNRVAKLHGIKDWFKQIKVNKAGILVKLTLVFSVSKWKYLLFVISLAVSVLQEHVKPVLVQNEGAVVQPDTEGSDSVRHVATSVLYHCVSVSLALLSPFMPFITEELWQRLQPFRHGAASQTSLTLQPYPCSSQLVGPQPSNLLIHIKKQT